MTLGRLGWIAGLVCAAAAIAVQMVPVERTNPPPLGAIEAPPEIVATLRRACFDCHSNETRWPWYSRVAPISWIVARDVNRGRMEVNFSDWASYYPMTRKRKLEWIGRALSTEQMPPWNYRLMHPGARLSAADRAALERWVDSALAAAADGKPN